MSSTLYKESKQCNSLGPRLGSVLYCHLIYSQSLITKKAKAFPLCIHGAMNTVELK